MPKTPSRQRSCASRSVAWIQRPVAPPSPCSRQQSAPSRPTACIVPSGHIGPLHAAFADVLIRRRKVLPALLAGALPGAMEIRHAADDRQPGPSQRQVQRVVLTAEQLVMAIKEVWHRGQGSSG